MSNKKEQWGNIELPGLSDEELLSKNWNKSRKHLPGWKELQKEIGSKRKESVVWQEAMQSRNDSIDWNKNVRTGSKKRGEEWKENQSNALRKKLAKPILTPHGIFPTITDAVKFELNLGTSNANKKIFKWLKDPASGYKYISVEEYIMLTGEDI